MASNLHNRIRTYAKSRVMELNESYTTTPTRTGTASNGTWTDNSANGATAGYISTDGPAGGAGCWEFETTTSTTTQEYFRVTSSPESNEAAEFSDDDWAVGFWFKIVGNIPDTTSTNAIRLFTATPANSTGFTMSIRGQQATTNASQLAVSAGTTQYSGSAVSTDTWHYVVVRKAGVSGTNNMTAYLDGTVFATWTNNTASGTLTEFGFNQSTANTAAATWRVSNFHVGSSSVMNADAISAIWAAGNTAPTEWDDAINSESTVPIFWTKFDETAGDAPATIAFTHTGSGTFTTTASRSGPATGAVFTTGGKSGNYVDFVGDTVTTGRTRFVWEQSTDGWLFPDSSSWSIEFWARMNGGSTSASNPVILEALGGTTSGRTRFMAIGIYASYNGTSLKDKLFVSGQGSGSTENPLIESSITVVDNAWRHFVVTYDSVNNEMKLYINGTQNGSTVSAPSLTTFDIKKLAIGGDSAGTNSAHFPGDIDEIIFWDQELTSTDVLDHYESVIPPAVNVSYSAAVMATASPHAEFPMPTITAGTGNTINADPMLTSSPHAELVDPTFDVSSPIDVDAAPSTASADSVTPTLSLDAVLDTLGVSTASADIVHPTITVESNLIYNADPATASSEMVQPTIYVERYLDYSASPATASALLSDNFYGGNTNQDTTYSLHIRQVQSNVATNTTGNSGFTVGTVTSGGVVTNRKATFIIPISGFMERNKIVKVKLDPAAITPITTSDVSPSNTFNIYAFDTTVTNPTTVIYGDLPAKTLLYTTRLIDDGSNTNFYLDLTPAFTSLNGYTYGIFIEHVSTSTGTDTDQTTFDGNDLNNKALYILAADIINRNINAGILTATGDMTAVTVDTQKYVDYSAAPATASAADILFTVSTEGNLTTSVDEFTASALAVQPEFSGGISYTSDHLEAFAEGLAFIVSTTRNVNISVDPSTASALFHMPQTEIGEVNTVDHMSASALFVMPTVVIPDTNTADIMTASATSVDPSVATEIKGIVVTEPMTASAFQVDQLSFYNFLSDEWYARLNTFHNAQPGSPAYPFIKWMRQSSNLTAGGTFTDDRGYGNIAARTWTSYTPWTGLGTPTLEVGYFDNQNRKAVRFNNIAFEHPAGLAVNGVVTNNGAWTFEMMFKTSKQNQEILYDFRTLGGSSNQVFRLGLNGGKFYSIYAPVGTSGGTFYPGNPEHDVVPWNPAYGPGSQYYVEGFKNIADGQWHHVVIQFNGGTENRQQIWIDGELDFQRYGKRGGWPGFVGGNSWDVRGSSDFYMSAMSLLPNVFLSERDIKLNYYAAFGFKTIEAAPMTATLNMTQNNNAQGNRPRALALYWWPNQRLTQVTQETDLYDDSDIEFDYETFFNIDTYNTKSQKFYGWDVYAVDVTGTYYSEVVKRDSYSGDIVTVNPGAGQPYTISTRGFRDPVTDNRRYIDIFNDIDLTQVESIFFLNFPNESREQDAFLRDESVDTYFGIKEKELYEDFLTGLRKAVDAGVSLMISNSQLAIDLGIVDRVEIVDPLIDGISYGPAGGTNLPEIKLGADWNNDKDRALALVPGSAGKQDSTRGNWADYDSNNKLRIVNTIPGITDLMLFTNQDTAYFVPNGIFAFGTPPELYTKTVYHPQGVTVGTEFIMPDLSNPYDKNDVKEFARRYLAVPFANVKAGKIVAAFGQNYKRGNTTIANPYANYATHIALEVGTVLKGKPIGGRIWVSLTERPQLSTNAYSEVELTTDYWINLAHTLDLITDAQRTTYLNSPTNLDRQLAAGTITQAEYNKRTYWSELGYNQTTSVSSSLRNTVDQAVGAIGKLFEQIFTKQQGQNAEEAGYSGFFGYNSSGIIATVQNYYSEPRVVFPTVSLNGAAFGWLADKEVATGVFRDVAGIAQASMVQPQVVGQKILSVNAQAMVASATQVDPTNYTWTQKDVNIVSLPMTATATITPRLTKVVATPMTATANTGQDISAYVAQVDQIVLYINHVDPILYLREDIVK